MGKRGPPPKPTVLKLLQGNPGRRPINKNEPQPDVAIPPAPEHFSPRAAEKWADIAPRLAKLGILTTIDGDALALYCESWSTYVDAHEQIQKFGKIVKSPKSGYPIASPYIGIANTAHDHMRQLMTEFGMTPSSRSRIDIGGRIPSGRANSAARGNDKKAAASRILD